MVIGFSGEYFTILYNWTMNLFPQKLVRGDDGVWHWIPHNRIVQYFQRKEQSLYQTQLAKVMTLIDPIFQGAKEKCEAEFVKMLLRFKGMQPPMYDPYQVSVRTIESLQSLLNKTKDEPLRTSLALYAYAHVLESAEPFEMMANCLKIIGGDRYTMLTHFPPIGRRDPTPSERIKMLIKIAHDVEIHSLDSLEKEIGWDRNLRNGIFHSDYGISREHIVLDQHIYTHERFTELVNRAMAYFDGFKTLYRYHVMSYSEPKILTLHPQMGGDPEQRWVTMTRKGYGLIAVQSAWTVEQERMGKIRMRIAQGFTQKELALLKRDPSRAIYPNDRNVTWP